MKIIDSLKKVKGRYSDNAEFSFDRRFFWKNYSKSKKNINKISYDLIRETHSIEKGLSCMNPRPFGKKAILNIEKLLNEYYEITSDNNFSIDITLSTLNEYKKRYEENNWTNEKTYVVVQNILSKNHKFEKINSGSIYLTKSDLESAKSTDFKKILETRHCVRKFSNKKVSSEDIEYVIKCATLSPSACNRQMIKVYNCCSDESIDLVKKYSQGLSCFDLSNISFMIITYDVSSLYFVGERNQGLLNTGLFSMNLVNAMHCRGIGSCFLQYGCNHKIEENMKEKLDIPETERIGIIIAYGYYEDTSVPCSPRKKIQDIYMER